jgi:hypothetical protein
LPLGEIWIGYSIAECAFIVRRRRSSHWHREANMPGQMDRGLRP